MTDPRFAPWRILARRTAFQADPWLKVEVQKVELPNGRVVDEYLQVRCPRFAIVVARTRDGRVVSVRNYKHGIGDVTLDLPAGMIEEGEEALASARRELLEETGYRAECWRALGEYTLHANYGCGRGFFFLAENAECVAEPESGDLEEMDVFLMSMDEWQAAIARGEVKLMSTVTAIELVHAIDSGKGPLIMQGNRP